MRQLVGLNCGLCDKTGDRIVEGRFCTECGCPVHKECIRPTTAEDGSKGCATCGATLRRVKTEKKLEREDEALEQAAREQSSRLPYAYIVGLVGLAFLVLRV